MMRKQLYLLIGAVIIGLIVWFTWPRSNDVAAPTVTNIQNQQQSNDTTKQSQQPKTFNDDRYSLTKASSLWVIVNKQHPLEPATYVPDDLRLPDVPQRIPGATEMRMRASAATALEKLFSAADTDNISILISTAYRSYSYQSTLYNGYVSSQGQAAADKQSARPGYSEHQTGWAVDIRAQSGTCPLETCFGKLAEGKWLAQNAYKYGFILRYPEGKRTVTGYEYEPWHFRYVGTYLTKQMHKTGVETLEEFFDVSGGTSY